VHVRGNALESVTYNPAGDRLSKTGSGLYTGAYGYNPNTHQLVSVGNAALTVDANGITTAISGAGSVYGFGYNNRNRLTVAQLGGSTLANYTYDALGQRIQKIANGQTESYVYNEAGQLLAESGATNRDYIWMDGIPVANIDTSSGSSTMTYVTADQLGTPRAIADANGNTVWQLPYQGNPWAEQSPVSNGYTYNLRFAGQYADAETGLVHNGFRDYCPGCGRYVQSDPIGLFGGQSSTYAYVSNSPLTGVDPSGLNGIYLLNHHAVPISGGTFGEGGHAAVLVGNDQSGWTYYSENGIVDGQQDVSVVNFATLSDFDQMYGSEYPMQLEFPTNPDQDQAMRNYANSNLDTPYNGVVNNCADFALGTLEAGGVNYAPSWSDGFISIPNTDFENLANSNPNTWAPDPNFPGMGNPGTWKYTPPHSGGSLSQ